MNETVASLLRCAAWTIPGNLGSDPEIRYLSSGTAVCNFNLAVNKAGAKKGDGSTPDWFKVEVWGDQAQVAADTLHKGSRCVVTGRVRTETWTGKDGQDRTTTVIRAEEWFEEWGGASTDKTQPVGTVSTAAVAAAPTAWATSNDIEEETPF